MGRAKAPPTPDLPHRPKASAVPWHHGHASQELLDDLAALTEAGTPEYIRVEMKVGTIRRTYRGYVETFNPQGSVGDKRMATLTMKLFERVAPNPRVVA